jgi:hypothetical protein
LSEILISQGRSSASQISFTYCCRLPIVAQSPCTSARLVSFVFALRQHLQNTLCSE